MKNIALLIYFLCLFSASTTLAEKIWYFPSATNEDFQGYLWITNLSNEEGEIAITATDDLGTTHDPVTLNVAVRDTAELTATFLESGDEEEAFEGLGEPVGNWRLRVESDLKLEILPYVRTSNSQLVPMHSVVPHILKKYRIANFRVSDSEGFNSQLRLINTNEHDVDIAISATQTPATREPDGFSFELLAGHSYELKVMPALTDDSGINELICEHPICHTTLAEGVWELQLTSSMPIVLMHIGTVEPNQITNLSNQPNMIWNDLVVSPEARCASEPYLRDEYGTRYSTKEPDIQESLGAIFSPYTGECFDSLRDTDIEHIVAIAEAHESGMCEQDMETKQTFAGDLINLTLADPDTNRKKSSKDAYDWLPVENQCWFAIRVLTVKRKFNMTIDKDEAEALEAIISECDSYVLDVPTCAQ